MRYSISTFNSKFVFSPAEAEQEEDLPHPDEPLPALGPLLAAVLVYEHRHPGGNDHQDVQVLEQWIPLSAH